VVGNASTTHRARAERKWTNALKVDKGTSGGSKVIQGHRICHQSKGMRLHHNNLGRISQSFGATAVSLIAVTRVWPVANMLMNFISPKTRYPVQSVTEDSIVLCSFAFTQYQRVTDRRTDRNATENTAHAA